MLIDPDIKKYKQDVSENRLFQSRVVLVKCFADPTCFKMLYILANCKYVCPTDFSEILDLSLPTISHQLAKLRQIGIITTVRHGQMICYFLRESQDTELVKKMVKILLK